MGHIEIANKWREQNEEHASNGVVLIWAGEVYGWKNCLRDAQHERPGAIAVDADEHVFIAEGGNDDDGAKRWVVQK
ncbi:antirestriction protein ArdR [Serratia fonticola]|uniref:antirestriction protein ArdR n=1 Tax=Serratia fonticola TaxID=47917 RepID=UPI000939FD26|nr:antirestriction protein ArdR [Serratia fonticola]OKP21764.1 antirestriction protein ArdR [Serratia fonticola]